MPAAMLAAEPGAIVDSSTSNRATANRTGANGSSGGREAPGDAGTAPALEPGVALGAAVIPGAPDGRADASGAGTGVTV